MTKKTYFPKIKISRSEKGFYALAGIKLKSILKGDLLIHKGSGKDENLASLHRLNPEIQQKNREAFLHALSSWPENITLELHLLSRPDLLCPSQGSMLMTLFLIVTGEKRSRVKEETVIKYLSLMPILAAYLPEAEFAPVVDERELNILHKPFRPAHCLTVKHREEDIFLSAPIKRPSVTGFSSKEVTYIEKTELIRHCYPWVPSMGEWTELLNTLTAQLNPYQCIVRLKTAAMLKEDFENINNIIRKCETFLTGVEEYQITLRAQVEMIRNISLLRLSQLSSCSFSLGVFLLSPGYIDTALGNVVGDAITQNRTGANGELFQGGFSCGAISVKDAQNSGFFPEKQLFTLPEAASAFRLPSPPMEDIPGFPIKRSRTSIAALSKKAPHSAGSIELFINEHRGIIQPVRVGADDRMRHTFIIGQTGTGKSTLMESMILQDIHAGRGVAVIDPHGDMIESILGKIPRQREEEVVLFDLLDRERPLGFNIIQWNTVEERDLIIDDLYLTLHKMYDFRQTGGPIFESYFRGALKLLMGDKARDGFIPTLLEFPLCFSNKDFRKWLKSSITDQSVLDLIEEMESAGGEVKVENLAPYITSKFNRFVHDVSLKRIVGQGKTTFDFDDIMNKGKILLIKLGKGRFGSTVSALIANQIVSRFKLAAMKRGDIPADKRRDFFLYVDECHNLPPENFMELLSEARKYRLGLILSTQYAAQLKESQSGGNNLLSAILGNVGTILSFRLGKEDAEIIIPAFEPCFSETDITGLANWSGYAHIQLNNEPTPPFSFRTEKDVISYSNEIAAKCKTLSRLKYGTDCSEVDSMIAQRRSVWKKA